MTSHYVLSEIAEQDIDDVIAYIAKENVQAAYEFVNALYDAFEKLADNPYLGCVFLPV